MIALLFLAAAGLGGGGLFLCHWLLCRLLSRRCPECGSKFRTQFEGETGGWELWTCSACRECWQVYHRRV